MKPSKKVSLWNPLKHRSISSELAISLVVLIFLIEGLLLFVVYQRQARYLYRELEAKANDYAVNLSEILAVPLWDYDDEQIRKIGEGFEGNELVSSLEIYAVDDHLLFRFQRSGDQRYTIERMTTIEHRGQVIGKVHLILSEEAYRLDLAWLRNTIILILAVSLVVIIITTGILMRILMRKPLSILQKGIDRVSRGEYDYGFDEVRHAELTGIASRFSEMADEIRARENTLQREVSERIRAEEKIRESEARSQAIIDAIPDMIVQIDSKGHFVDFRGDHRRIIAKPDQFIGRSLEDVLPTEIAGRFRSQLTKTFESRLVRIFEYELPVAGQISYHECRLVAVSQNLALAIIRDITDAIRAEKEKQRLLEQLQRAHKMEAIGMLAGGVAHDLNNVLSGLVSYPELVLLDLPAESPLRRPMQIIQQSGEKAANIVQDLLTLARRGVSVSEVANLNDIIEEYLKSPEYEKLRRYHPEIDLHVDLAPELLNLTGSPVHLGKTVMNLISNAAEACEKGGQIRITTRNRYIDSPIKGYDDIEEGDYVVLRIVDDGVGISAEDIHRIFEPFYTKKVMGRSGTGLGMAVVWGTVKDHQGYIDMQSEQHRGTMVTVYLPATREEGIRKKSADTFDLYAGRGEHILVVDDVAEQREIAKGMLTKLGYSVEAVKSGEAALEYMADHPVDILVLDMIMDPGIDGLETYRRAVNLNPGQRAVITSGFSESDRVHQAHSLGAGSYVKKPYRLESIAKAIREELDR